MSAAKIKKVKPYPILTHITIAAGAPFTADIIKLVLKGFMMDMNGKVLKVGTTMQVTFELPVLKKVIVQNVKVIRTFDRSNPKTRSIDRLAECHFLAVSDEQQNNIYTFLQMIRQDDIT